MPSDYVTPSGRRHEFDAGIAHRQLVQRGGFSMQRTSGRTPPARGYMVSDYGSESVIPGHASPAEIEKYRQANPNPRARPLKYVGGWVDEGKTYLDQSRRVLHARTAQATGRQNAQRAVYSLKTGESRRVHFGGRTDVRGTLFEGHADPSRELRVGNSDALRQQREMELHIESMRMATAGHASSNIREQAQQGRLFR